MPRYERLSALDRSFLDIEGSSYHMHVAAACIFEASSLRLPSGGLDIERVRAYLAARLHLIPRYRQRVEWIPIENHPVWVDDDRFNIEYHVRHTSLPRPGDDEQLRSLCARLMAHQLDRGKPLWEIWFVEGLEDDRVAMITKVHHCMIDGVSGGDLLAALLSATPEKEFDAPPRWVPDVAPGPGTLLRDALLRRARAPFDLAANVIGAVRDPRRVARDVGETLSALRETAAAGARPASETPFNREIGPHRRFAWLGVDLDEAKRIKTRLGGTLNDVVLAVTAGAIGRFLERRGIGPAEQRELDFRAFCPVSTRAPSERGQLGNRVSGMIAPLPIGDANPGHRLARIHETTQGLKETQQVRVVEALSLLSEWTHPALLGRAADWLARFRSYNVVITNVPGPQLPLYLLGARMLEIYPLVPLFADQGLGIALFSYAGGLYWGLNVDWDLVPDIDDFVVVLDESFRELAAASEEAG